MLNNDAHYTCDARESASLSRFGPKTNPTTHIPVSSGPSKQTNVPLFVFLCHILSPHILPHFLSFPLFCLSLPHCLMKHIKFVALPKDLISHLKHLCRVFLIPHINNRWTGILWKFMILMKLNVCHFFRNGNMFIEVILTWVQHF